MLLRSIAIRVSNWQKCHQVQLPHNMQPLAENHKPFCYVRQKYEEAFNEVFQQVQWPPHWLHLHEKTIYSSHPFEKWRTLCRLILQTITNKIILCLEAILVCALQHMVRVRIHLRANERCPSSVIERVEFFFPK